MLRPKHAQRRSRSGDSTVLRGVGFGRRPFSCARATVPHSQRASLGQYGWFSLSQRSDAGRPGAEAPGLLFVSGRHATVSGVRFFSIETVATDDVFRANTGAFPSSHSEPLSRKVMKPRIFPCAGASGCAEPGVTRARASVGADAELRCYESVKSLSANAPSIADDAESAESPGPTPRSGAFLFGT